MIIAFDFFVEKTWHFCLLNVTGLHYYLKSADIVGINSLNETVCHVWFKDENLKQLIR